MKRLTQREAAALAALDDVGTAETNRETIWHLMAIQDRERAMGVAGLTREQAHWPLAKFSEAERERVRLAISVHVSRMELIAQCMAPAWSTATGWLH